MTPSPGERFVLALASMLFSPEPVIDTSHQQPWGKQAVQEGVLRPEWYGGYRVIQDGVQRAGTDIDRMTDLKDYKTQPHACLSLVVHPGRAGTVALVELIYSRQVTQGEAVSSVTLRPAWRFSGYTSGGGLFEALVEATRP